MDELFIEFRTEEHRSPFRVVWHVDKCESTETDPGTRWVCRASGVGG